MRFVRVMVAVVLALPLLTSDVFAAAGTKLTVQVNSADTGKPIDRASVIVRFRHGLNPIKMKKIQTNWETKTSQEGTVSIPEIPMGEVEIQVIAKYYQTSGGIYQLDQPEQTVKIKLNSPQTQYSEDSKTK
jgi:5-hydroxyisourate hydrolase-like protein (transthyretin family)